MKELRLLGRSEPWAYYAARTTRTGGNVSAVMFPPWTGDLLDPDALYGYALLGKGVRLVCEVVIMPPLVSALGGRSWLEEHAPPTLPKALQRKFRTTLLDGVLLALRTMKQAAVTAAAGFGEGPIVLMAVPSPELRKAAYVERKAAEAERKELEEVGEALGYAVLFAPHRYPLKSYMPLLRECVPEIAWSRLSDLSGIPLRLAPVDPRVCPESIAGSGTESAASRSCRGLGRCSLAGRRDDPIRVHRKSLRMSVLPLGIIVTFRRETLRGGRIRSNSTRRSHPALYTSCAWRLAVRLGPWCKT